MVIVVLEHRWLRLERVRKASIVRTTYRIILRLWTPLCLLHTSLQFDPWSSFSRNSQYSAVNTGLGLLYLFTCRGNSIVIPEGVTSIEINTFSSCKNLVSVSLPETITAIGQSAFFLCEQLQTITIPSNITCIEPDAFYKCENLTSVTFENPTSWYITEDKNETQGSEIDVTNASDNAIRLTKKYSDYYWYQK